MTNSMIGPEVITTAQQLSKQEHSVLLIIILLVLGTAFVLVIKGVAKYFIRQHDMLLSDHKEARAEYHESLQRMLGENHKIMSELGVTLARNTDALNTCTAAFKLVHDRFLRP